MRPSSITRGLFIALVLCALTGCISTSYYSNAEAMSLLADQEATASPVVTSAATPSPAPTPTPVPTPTPRPERMDARLVFISNGHDDVPHMQSAVNERLIDALNIAVTVETVPWTTWSTEYYARVEGSQGDLFGVSQWARYRDLARGGAFMELDEPLERAGTRLGEVIGLSMMDMARVDGALYAIPRADRHIGGGGALYREDVRKAVGAAPVTDADTLEAFLEAAAQSQETAVKPYIAASRSDAPLFLLSGTNGWASAGLPGTLYGAIEGFGGFFDALDTPEMGAYLETVVRWRDKGLFASPKTGRATGRHAFELGESAMCVAGYYDIPAIAMELKGSADSAELGYLHESALSGKAYYAPFSEGVALGASCAQPERLLSMLEFLLTDADAYDAMHYGVPGKHYTLDADGAVVRADGEAYGVYTGMFNGMSPPRVSADVRRFAHLGEGINERLAYVPIPPVSNTDVFPQNLAFVEEEYAALFYGKGDVGSLLQGLREAHREIGVPAYLEAMNAGAGM